MSVVASRSIRPAMSIRRLQRSSLSTGFQLSLAKGIERHSPFARPLASRTLASAVELPSKLSPTSKQSYANKIEPFSSRTLPETKALLLIAVPTPPKTWGGVVEKEDLVVGAANLDKNLREAQVRILATYEGGTTYSARLFRPDGTVAHIKDFSEATLGTESFKDLVDGKSSELKPADKAEVIVCTHGARDCRCGDIGGDLVFSLRKEAERSQGQTTVSECSHVGGHKFAANAILLPSMHMLGNLRPEDASALLKHVDNLEGKGDGPVDRNMWENFRGAFGRTIGEQVSMYDWNTGKKGEVEVDDRQTASFSPTPRRRSQQSRAYSTFSATTLTRATFRNRHSGGQSSRRSYSTGPESETTGEDGKAKGVGNKLKDLMKKYGRHALGVYLFLSAIDFGVAFLGVHLVGAERLEAVKDMAMEQWRKYRPGLETDNELIDDATDKAGKAAMEVLEKAQEGKEASEAGAPTQRKRSRTAMLWAEAALAYTIHKTLFLPVRVGLTAAWTPKLVKWLTLRGWIGKGGMGRAAAHAQDKVKDAQAKVKEARTRLSNKAD